MAAGDTGSARECEGVRSCVIAGPDCLRSTLLNLYSDTGAAGLACSCMVGGYNEQDSRGCTAVLQQVPGAPRHLPGTGSMSCRGCTRAVLTVPEVACLMCAAKFTKKGTVALRVHVTGPEFRPSRGASNDLFHVEEAVAAGEVGCCTPLPGKKAQMSLSAPASLNMRASAARVCTCICVCTALLPAVCTSPPFLNYLDLT